MTAHPYRVELGAGPAPVELIRRIERPGPLAALWGRWFGGGTIVLPEPVRVERTDRAEDAFALLDQQPELARPPEPGLLGGGWLACLGYTPGHTWLGFFDVLWRHRPATGWSFETLGLPGREDAARTSLAELQALIAATPDTGVEVAMPIGVFAADPDVVVSHLRGVESVIAGIERGDFYQLNLCTRLRSRLNGSAAGPGGAAAVFAAVADRLRPDYGSLIDFGDGRAVVSLSPELFWREHRGRVQSAPIKGTSAVDADPTGARLAGSVKDAAENVMITDLMRNDLSRVCRPGTVGVERLLELERHPGVWHLVSTVGGELRPGVGRADLMRATFPPGSVTGAPKLSALAGIAAVERHARGAYTGALGLVTPQSGAEFSVLIRTFEIDSDQIELGVGGGVTVDSVPVLEWYECLHKAGPLVAALGAELAPELRRQPPPVPEAVRMGGLIETMLARRGEVLRLAAHLARLDRSCRELYGVGLPPDLAGRVRHTAVLRAGDRVRIRVLVVPDGTGLAVDVESHPVGGRPLPIRLRRASRPGWCWRHKWADRSALDDPAAPAGDQPLTLPYFLTPDGHLAESSRGNLCLRRSDGVWVSPPESEHVLPGITRRDLLRELARRGERVLVEDVTTVDLRDAVALLHCSSVTGVVLVDAVDDQSRPVGDDLVTLVRDVNQMLGFGRL